MTFNKEIKIGTKAISPVSPVYIIAEAGVNHNGNIDIALQLVDKAKEAVSSVIVNPGATAFTNMLLSASSTARVLVNPTIPDFVSAYKDRPGRVIVLQIEVIFTIRP